MRSLVYSNFDQSSDYVSMLKNLQTLDVQDGNEETNYKRRIGKLLSTTPNESFLFDSSSTTDSTIASTPDSPVNSNKFRAESSIPDSLEYKFDFSSLDKNFLSTQQGFSNNSVLSSFPSIADKFTQRIRIKPWLQFGGFGNTNSNFTEPNSVVISPQGHIIIADTNSHHIKLFDGNGRFLYKFGEAGKTYGKMLYPCKIDLLPRSNKLVIVQRNPMPQIQIFNLNGQYENRFAGSILKFPRAMCVDEMGCIIVIESKVMTCHIFSPDGRHLRELNLQSDLCFPFDICANGGEIFISDNQAHSVKVFDYNGQMRRKIGEGIVKFPVCLDYCAIKKSIFITDNHERFNVNQFSLSGQLLNSFYSGIKHAQCYDVTTSNEDMILASRDYRIYRYRLP